jgi:2-polyprenyl-3-methyl-5-hydroxy-6-metoxy-1,4-benzoquinol methylase
MDPEYRKHYRDLFERHWWWRARSEFICGALERLRLDVNRTTILDVGCGDGLFFERLSRFGEVEGIEIQDALQPGSKWENQIHSCAFDETFQPSKKYSLILMLDVLEHLSEPVAALRNVRRLLAADGFFLATVPAFNAAWTNHDDLNEHITRYTKHSIRDELESAGLHIVEQHYFCHWVFLAKLLERGYEALRPRQPKVPDIPPRWINESLYRLSLIEQKTLGKIAMPFGSSLLVLAQGTVL